MVFLLLASWVDPMHVDEIQPMSGALAQTIDIQVDGPSEFGPQFAESISPIAESLVGSQNALFDSIRWLGVLRSSLGHQPYLVRATRGGKLVGALPLAFVKSAFFGKFLVSLPYVNSAGVIAHEAKVGSELMSSAATLADKLDVRYLELRSELEIQHPVFNQKNDTKVLMRRVLPSTSEELWDSFKSKLRSQIRAGQKNDFDVCFGGAELLDAFYSVFSQNMRDLGTPVYSRSLFASILRTFGDHAELCVLQLKRTPVAAALLVHGQESTEVPSASSLRTHNASNANMVMYWHLLERAVKRGQKQFDFGRSTINSNTYKFKAQWGAAPQPSVWQYYLRRGTIGELRPDNSKFGMAIKVWQRLPVWLTRLIGPEIVRGIP